MKNKIAQRLTLYFAQVLLLFALMAGVLFSLMFARHTADVTRSDLHAHAASIADTLSDFTLSYRQGACSGSGFRAYLRFIGDAAMSELYLLDEQGEMVVLGEMTPPPTPLPEGALPLAKRVFETGEMDDAGFSMNPMGTEAMIVCAPVMDGQGRVQYALVMCAQISSISHALEDTFYILTACLAIAMVLAILASGFLSRRFVTPLYRMGDAATRMAGGDYSVKTGVAQQDEIGMLAVHIDALADKLAETEKERSRFEQMRQEFFSDISHELRTPVSVIKGSIELLREEMIEDPQQRKLCCDQLYRDADYLQRLVNDLLELNRLQNTQFKIEMDVINLMDVLADTIRFMRQKAEKKNLQIHLDEAAPFAVLGDYGRLLQMMIILLDNAIKFSPEGESVHIAVKKTKDACEISVIDHGCGIDEEELAYIFDRYFHKKSGENRSGTGLGLPIARGIARRHGVDLTCTSGLGEGTRFTLVFAEYRMAEQ